jgi:hypothetical protein
MRNKWLISYEPIKMLYTLMSFQSSHKQNIMTLLKALTLPSCSFWAYFAIRQPWQSAAPQLLELIDIKIDIKILVEIFFCKDNFPTAQKTRSLTQT